MPAAFHGYLGYCVCR